MKLHHVIWQLAETLFLKAWKEGAVIFHSLATNTPRSVITHEVTHMPERAEKSEVANTVHAKERMDLSLFLQIGQLKLEDGDCHPNHGPASALRY
jgi:hypothetical protein